MKPVKILFITIALAGISLTINAKNCYVAMNGSVDSLNSCFFLNLS